MTDVDVGHLLYEACTKLGYCMAEEEVLRLIADPPLEADVFTDAVLRAAGLDPLLMARADRQQLRTLVDRYFSPAP